MKSRTLKVAKKSEAVKNDDFRPIVNYETIGVLFQRVILEYLIDDTKANLSSLQFAYRENYSKELATVTILQHIQKIKSLNQCYAVLSFDLKDAFTSVDHKTLFDKLRAKSVNERIIQIIEYFLQNSETEVWV